MKLRDKIDAMDAEIAMLNKSVWYIMKKLDIEPTDIIKAEKEIKREQDIAEIQEKAQRLGLKVGK